jgi:hypothetical protein
MADFSPIITKKKKEGIWALIYNALIANGAAIKDISYLHRTEWPNLKRAVTKKFREAQRSGASGDCYLQ